MFTSPWDVVNLCFALTVHAVMAALGWFVFASNYQEAGLNIAIQGFGIIIGFWIGIFATPKSPSGNDIAFLKT
jgi:hypothetical protein